MGYIYTHVYKLDICKHDQWSSAIPQLLHNCFPGQADEVYLGEESKKSPKKVGTESGCCWGSQECCKHIREYLSVTSILNLVTENGGMAYDLGQGVDKQWYLKVVDTRIRPSH